MKAKDLYGKGALVDTQPSDTAPCTHYEIRWSPEQGHSCNCQGFKRSKKYGCKHVKRYLVKEKLVSALLDGERLGYIQLTSNMTREILAKKLTRIIKEDL